jgi:hypothetical protein
MRHPGDAGYGGNRGPSGGRQSPRDPAEFEGRRPKIPPPEWTVKGQVRWQYNTPIDPLIPATNTISSALGGGFNPVPAPRAGQETGYWFTDSWSTPIFDLRPDLLSQIGNTKQGFQIWSKSARLRVALFGSNGTDMNFDESSLTIRAREWVSVFDANVQGGTGGNPNSSPSPNLIQLTESDVTALFFPTNSFNTQLGIPSGPGTGNALAGFSPRGSELGGGEGYPVRYWRMQLIFASFIPGGLPLALTPPTRPQDIVLNAGMY